MATHVLTGTPLSARGILLSLRQAISAHAAWMVEPDAREVAVSTAAHHTGFPLRLLGDVRHTV